MIKVLLVDDENMALEYLETIIQWEYYGFQLIGVTTDPDQALRLYKKYKPELVITDVKMPGMNGLELVNAIREYGGQSHILFLSAYKNFDYIKQAIRLDIDDYLLKSDLEEESFLKKILKLKEEIDKEKAKNEYTLGVILETLFKKNVPEEHYKRMLDETDYIRLHKKYYYMILAEKNPPKFLEKYFTQNGHENYEYEFLNACTEAGREKELWPVTVFPVNENEYLAILEADGGVVAQKEIFEQIYYYARQVFQAMNMEKQPFHLYYFVNKMSVREFGRFYMENKNQMSQRYLRKKAELVEFAAQRPQSREVREPQSITSDEIYQKIKQEDQEAISNYLQTIKIAIAQEDCFSYLWYVKNVFEALNLYVGFLAGEKSGRRFSIVENSSSYDFSDPAQMIGFIEQKINEIWMMFHESEKEIYSKSILKAITFIKESYEDPQLSSNMVAGHVNISASWLSTRFKEEVGIGVSDYINSVRIEQAKKRLKNYDEMVYEVSEKVGFTSSQYFSKIFKEYGGCTPNQYKRNCMNKREPL